jgi:hypothetical protein
MNNGFLTEISIELILVLAIPLVLWFVFHLFRKDLLRACKEDDSNKGCTKAANGLCRSLGCTGSKK